MTHDDDHDCAHDPDSIEEDLAENRSGLATALDELGHRASVDYIAREALGMLKANSHEATRSLDRALRANPMAFALIGAGVAWMVMGGTGTARPGHVHDPDPDWHSQLGGARDKARSTLAKLEDEARLGLDHLKAGLSEQVGQVRDFGAERAKVIEDFTSDLKSAIGSGLEHVAEGTRQRIMQARQESYSALLRAELMVKDGVQGRSREAAALVQDHPLAVGAVALAAGSLVGLLLLRNGAADRGDSAGGRAHKASPAQGRSRQGATMSTGGSGRMDPVTASPVSDTL